MASFSQEYFLAAVADSPEFADAVTLLREYDGDTLFGYHFILFFCFFYLIALLL